MTAYFFLTAASFANNHEFSEAEIEEKIMRLFEAIHLINTYPDANKLLINYTEIYPLLFYGKYTVEQFVCNVPQLKSEGVDRDVLNAFQSIIQKSESTLFTSSEIIEELIEMTDEENSHGIIAFHPIPDLKDDLHVIFGDQSWYQFRRHYLAEYPKDEAFFMEECGKYYPNLIFHENNVSTVGAILDRFAKKINYHLSALNDRFYESMDGLRNRQQVLEHFSINCNLDQTASLEGNAKRKSDFTYDFVDDTQTMQSVCCEPHLKLCQSDVPGDNTYYQYRIYFHEGFENISNNKILVGHIGEHL